MEGSNKQVAEKKKVTNMDIEEVTVNQSKSQHVTLWLLNVIRGISAILIVLYHYTTQYEASIGHIQPYSLTVPWGCYAVYTFFALSGFLTLYSYRSNLTAAVFLKKRFVRLYPTFWICVIVTSVYMMILMPERVKTVKEIIINLTMIPSIFHTSAVDGVYWTLVPELIFYIMFAVLIKTGWIKNVMTWLWCGLIGEIIVAIYCFCPIAFPFQGWIQQILIPDYLYVFLAGCALFELNYIKKTGKRVQIILYLLICVAYSLWIHSFSVSVYLVFSLLLIALCANFNINKRTQQWKKLFSPILFVAEISYPLYLTHQFIGFGIIQ
mgnify:FL=1